MSGIRGSNTSPEMKVRKLPHRYGNRYRLHQRNTPGRPSIVLCSFQGLYLRSRLLLEQTSGLDTAPPRITRTSGKRNSSRT
ncbi:very short patch repair endonuclease [Pseudomonas sp. 770NI]|uniref:very short patch repair endonuclease n=1 Tax=Pseudomonas sp. 770NI TaxID=2528664 RepID=UPI001EE2ED6A|nr:very short patch repair endonuclease [Pseudomonas sp. 770NI]